MRNGFFRRFAHHVPALVSSIFLILLVIALFVLPAAMHLDPYSTDVLAMNKAPRPGHPLGTDGTGRDILARLCEGGKISLYIGTGSALISMLIGIPLGLIAGGTKGFWSSLIMRLADMFMSFPAMILVLVTVAMFGSSVSGIMLILGILGWPAPARLLSANVMAEKEKNYVASARLLGRSETSILLRSILPNAISPLWTSLAFRISQSMILESGLSFLGAGVQPPLASWGNMMQAAGSLVVLTTRPWQWLPAGICLIVSVVSINFIGEGIRDALDPRLR